MHRDLQTIQWHSCEDLCDLVVDEGVGHLAYSGSVSTHKRPMSRAGAVLSLYSRRDGGAEHSHDMRSRVLLRVHCGYSGYDILLLYRKVLLGTWTWDYLAGTE